jgi:hypothetical protein
MAYDISGSDSAVRHTSIQAMSGCIDPITLKTLTAEERDIFRAKDREANATNFIMGKLQVHNLDHVSGEYKSLH